MSMEKLCDLHAHSTASDGSLTPTELLELAVRQNLAAVVLCDHNTTNGLAEFVAAAENMPVEAVPGVEFSTEFENTELHILALFVEPQHYATINALTDDFKKRKEESNRALVEALNAAGFSLDVQHLYQEHSYVNRAHIAEEMTKKGYTTSVAEAFKTYLSPKFGYYVPPKRPDAFEVIRFIKSIGAVAVLAHPFLDLDESGLRRFLEKATTCGLDGMETLYAKYDPQTTALAQEIAVQYDLLQSGGSDFHGSVKPDTQLGTGRGELKIPYRFLEALKARKK